MLLDVLRPLQLCAKSREQHQPSCFEIAKGIHCPCGSAGSPNLDLYTPRFARSPWAHLKAQRRSVPAQISRRLSHSEKCHAVSPCLWYVLLRFFSRRLRGGQFYRFRWSTPPGAGRPESCAKMYFRRYCMHLRAIEGICSVQISDIF